MSENEKKEMLEKENAVFEQEISGKEMEQVAGGVEEYCPVLTDGCAFGNTGECSLPNPLRGDIGESDLPDPSKENA